MNHYSPRTRVIAVATCAALAAAAAISIGVAWQNRVMPSASYSDRRFIEEMIPHHEAAIAMANLAAERASSSEVKTLGAIIVAAQEREITQMRQWYQQWYGAEVPAAAASGQHGGGHSGDDSLESLRTASDFDQEFMRQMIPHHESAVVMAGRVLELAEHQEIKDLARDIINSQSDEIEQMKRYQASGFGAETTPDQPHCDSVVGC